MQIHVTGVLTTMALAPPESSKVQSSMVEEGLRPARARSAPPPSAVLPVKMEVEMLTTAPPPAVIAPP